MNIWKNQMVWLGICAAGFVGPACAAEPPVKAVEQAAIPFDGEKTSWHGFDRYDFLMDEATLVLKPIKAEDDEKDGIKHNIQGKRRCIIVVPKLAAAGNPWSWRGCFLDNQPQTGGGLLKSGFYFALVEV